MKSRITSTPLSLTSQIAPLPLLGLGLDDLEEVLLGVIDHHIRAQLLAGSHLLRSLGRRVHLVAESLRHLRIREDESANLNGARADARSASVHHERLAGLQLASHEDIAVGREEGLANGRGVNHVRILGNRQSLWSHFIIRSYTHGAHGHVLSVATAGQNTADLIAHFEVQAILRHCHDRSRALQTGNVGSTLGGRVHALSLTIRLKRERRT